MQKVLFLVDTLQMGGAEKSLLEISTRLKRFEPIICHLYKGDMLAEEFRSRNVRVISLNLPGPYQFRKAIKLVNQIVDQHHPSIVHSMLFRSDMVARFIDKTDRIIINSLVSNSYTSSRYEHFSFLRRLKHRAVEVVDRLTAKRADVFIANADVIARENSRILCIPEEKVHTIHRGRDIGLFSSPAVGDIKNELGLPADCKILLNVSRLLNTKGQDTLIRAFADIHKKFPRVFLLIAGEGRFRSVLEPLISRLGLQNNVILLGNRTDVPSLLAQADCFVFPSLVEGMPGSLIEAMMAKKPIVASDIAENLECVNDDAAFIYKAGDVSALQSQIERSLANARLSEMKAHTAYQIALQKFDINAVAARYDAFYEQLLGG